MSDLIDRQAAIDLLKQMRKDGDMIPWEGKDVFARIRKLPPAQPDVPDANVGDMINRQDVLALAKDVILINGAKHRCIDATQIHELPSAQPEPIRINLNEPIKVKLTDWGKEIYYHQYDRINQIAGREICKPMFPKENENGYTEFQLWCFIQLYGEYIGMTMPNVIEPLEIVYER